MEAIDQKVDIHQLRELLSQARSAEEIRRLHSLIPVLTEEERELAHRNMDDGIYDANGALIGEQHPDD